MSAWSVIEQCAEEIGIERFGAHDLRRAKLCRKPGGNIKQIKFLLGHSSIQTTERYLGSEKEIAMAVNDTAIAINMVRIAFWVSGTPIAQTRCSHFAALQFQAA